MFKFRMFFILIHVCKVDIIFFFECCFFVENDALSPNQASERTYYLPFLKKVLKTVKSYNFFVNKPLLVFFF